jgi:acetyl-CoA synthase
MSLLIAEKAERGSQAVVDQAERTIQKAIADHGSRGPFSYTNTSYYLPIILAKLAKPVEKIGDLQAVIQQARGLLATGPAGSRLAALLASEAIEVLRLTEQPLGLTGSIPPTSLRFNSPVSDAQVRTWSMQLSDGRIPGIALLLGHAKNHTVAAALVHELRRHNILCFLGGGVIDQVQEEGIRPGSEAAILASGSESSAVVHTLGFVARAAMKLGGHRPGSWTQILKYGKRNAPGFVLALGDMSDAEYELAQTASDFGFSLIADTGAAKDSFESAPFEALPGTDDEEKAQKLIEKCVTARGLKLKSYKVSVPVAYGPAFEEQVISDIDLSAEYGGRGHSAFELVQIAPISQVTDGRIHVTAPNPDVPTRGDLGIIVKVAGKKLKTDYEPLLERQIDSFLNYANGVRHTGSADAISILIANQAAAEGFTLESLGRILQARFHQDFRAVEKVEIELITEPSALSDWQARARQVHKARRERLASMTDDKAELFYVCTNCRAFAPHNVSIISPERVSPCGRCNWLDAKAGYELGSTRVRRPIKPGRLIDARKGIWEGLNEYAKTTSHGRVSEVALYSVVHSPVSACADFECIVMAIPEANGVMVLSHDDTSPTPAGVKVEIFASIAAGEQIPGVEGIGKSHLLSPKFISAEGGFKRVVWMSSILKTTMAEELKAVCTREGEPDLLDKIADEHQATSVPDLVRWLKERKHPALEMERIF